MTNSDREKSLRAHLPDATVDEHTAFRCGWNSALLAAGASEGQAEPVAWQFRDLIEGQWTKWRHANTAIRERYKDWPDVEFRPLYLHPSAEIAALRERIAGMEKDAELMRFLDVAAAEGYVFGGVDAGDLYQRLFPDPFDAAIAKEQK